MISWAPSRKRFAREAQAAAAVVDDHVMPIHYVAQWQGAPYFVMPYTRGLSLQKRLDQEGPLELREILRIGLQTSRGLAAAHAQGLVHRDIKPANIMLDEGVERAALVDFGLARAVDDASLTQSGMLAGTPRYMSPEQARGEQGTAAPDISGQWTGDQWSRIVLEPLDDEPNWYMGRYVSAEGDRAGTLQLSWSRLQQRFNGQWKQSGQRYGDLSIQVTESGEIRGALTIDAAVEETAAVPRLRDFVWTRKQRSDSQPTEEGSAKDVAEVPATPDERRRACRLYPPAHILVRKSSGASVFL